MKASFRFQAGQDPSTLRLAELPHEVLESLKDGHGEVAAWFVGGGQDEMALTTEDATYSLRFVEDSNSLFVVDVTQSEELLGALNGHIEVERAAPRTHRIDEMVRERQHYDPELGPGLCGVSLGELVNAVQASREEILASLHDSGSIVELEDERFAYATPDSVDESLSLTIDSLVLHGRSLTDLPCDAEELIGLVPESPRPLTRLVLRHFTQSRDSVRVFDGLRVGRFFVRRLLHELDPNLSNTHTPLSTFRNRLHAQSPHLDLESVPTSALLAGLALVENHLRTPSVRRFDASTLPREPAARFAALFAIRTPWTHEDLVPYVTNLLTARPSAHASELERLLRAHCRVARPVAGAPARGATQAEYWPRRASGPVGAASRRGAR